MKKIMIQKYQSFAYLVGLFLCISLQATDNQAVCIVPVAELLGQSMKTIKPHHNVAHSYHTLPCAYRATTPFFDSAARACPRNHQLIFNEIVTIKHIDGPEACIEIPHLFYETATSNKPQRSYWTLSTNLMPLNRLKKYAIPLHAIPQPLTPFMQPFSNALQGTVTLTFPFHDPVTNTTYSAGTRFVRADSTQEHGYTVRIFNPHKHTLQTTTIPHTHAMLFEQKTNRERIKDFVHLVRAWAHMPNGFFPYVWGGCSLVTTCKQQPLEQKSHHCTLFNYPELNMAIGLDCAGLIARAAQIVGIPYFYKNSLTISKRGTTVTEKDAIDAGDIIWIPGHVMVVSEVKQGLLVEARHYNHGYGKVHEIKLATQFQGIESYADLKKAFVEKKPLKRLNSNHEMVQLIPQFKIIKLASVWQT